jgi:argininosuccinate synthase
VDENCWNRSIEGGRLEDPSFHPPESIYRWTVSPEKAPDEPEEVTVTFEAGNPVALDGKRMKGYNLIQAMNERAGRNGVGRNDMIEDRILGLKAREIYEHPAATALITAHADLEHLVLTRAELAFKRMVDDRWSELAYQGLVHEPLFIALSSFIGKTQERVNGTVDLVLYRGSVRVAGRSSPDTLYSGEMVSFDSSSLDQGHAEGLSRYHGIQARIAKKMRER